MKIIFFDFSTLEYAGGCEKNFMNLGLWLGKRGHEAIYITATEKLNALYCSITRQGKHTQNLKKTSLHTDFGVKEYRQFGLLDLFFSTKNKTNIEKIMQEADRIYSKNELFEVLILKYIFKVDAGKIVLGFHTPILYPSARSLKSKLHNWVYNSGLYLNSIGDSRIRSLVLTTHDKEVLLKHNPNKNIAVIPNPLNISLFTQKKYERKGIFNIYYIGRMTEQKGIDILADAIEQLAESNRAIFSNIKFIFIGEGDKEYILKDLSQKYENCIFLGFKSSVVKYYQEADLVVAPSRWESFCYSVAEAQSSGIPVISTNIPGPRDIVIDKKTGWIIPPENSSALTDTILIAYEKWQTDIISYSKIGQEGRLNIISNFEENNVNKKIEKFLIQK